MKLRIVTLVCGLLLLAIPSRALVATWSGGGGSGNTDVTSLANWDLVPLVPGEDLIFPNVTYRQVNFDSATLLASILGSSTFTAGNMTFTNASNYSLSGSGTPLLELSGDMTLTATNVNTLSSLPFQLNTGAHHLVVNDTSLLQFGSAITGTGSLIKEGSGSLNIFGTGTYSGGTTITQGLVVVDGAFPGASISHASADLVVGGTLGGGGSLIVQSGGTVSAAQVRIGDNAGENGDVSVYGAGSVLAANSGLYIGNAGTGTLYLYDDGKLDLGGSGIITLGHTGPNGAGILKIGTDGTSYFSGGVINAAEITTGAGLSGELKFATTGTAANPYYLTQDGTSSGAPVLISGGTEVQQLNGFTVLKSANTYTGATLVSGGTLIVSDDNALGGALSAVTVNGGTLVVNEINLYNTLTLTSGTLAGNGFVPTAMIGTNFTLAPGLPANGGRIGSLDFEHLELASGGTLEWNLQNPNGSAGIDWDKVNVTTSFTLDVTATTVSRFTLKLISLDINGGVGTATGFVPGQPYSWLVFDSDGTANFDPLKFNLDLSQFVTDSVDIASITLSNTGNNLYLNFTPVPEPSTYALLALGLAGSGLAAWRKRRHCSRGR